MEDDIPRFLLNFEGSVTFWANSYRIRKGLIVFLPYRKFVNGLERPIDKKVRRVRLPIHRLAYIEER